MDEMQKSLKRTLRRRTARELAVPAAVFAVIVAMVAAVEPGVLSSRALVGFTTDAAPLLLLVIGGSVVILMGGIDLSVAAMASFAAVLFTLINPTLGDFGILVVVTLAAVIGASQGFVHAYAQIPSFVVSLGTMGMLYGVTHYISDATARPLIAPSPIIDFIAGRNFGVPNGFLIVLAISGVLLFAFRYTRLGRDVYAIGASERAALLSGVRTVRVRAVAFAISAACAAMAGLLLLSQTFYSSPAMANNFLLPAIVGVVVGGTAISGGVGGIMAAFFGGLIAVAVRVGTVIVGLEPAHQMIVFGLVILAAVSLTTDREKIGIVK